jgi:hypothetical protein
VTQVSRHALEESDDIATLAARLERLRASDADFARILAERAEVAKALVHRIEPLRDAPLLTIGVDDGALGVADAMKAQPLPAVATFGGAIVLDALTLLPEPERWLARLAAALRPTAPFWFATDFYAENTAVHGWRRRFELPYRLFSTTGWSTRLAAAGFDQIDASRIRVTNGASWRATRGSLVLTARRAER